MHPCLTNYTLQELTDLVKAQGEPAFRAKQLFDWLQKGASFAQMHNLPKGFIEKLEAAYQAQGVSIEERFVSAIDGTEKYLFSLADGNIVEGVLMHYKHGNTLCISTQVGCRMGCRFCASTLDGLIRNLSAGEMLSQVLVVNRLKQKGEIRGVTNVVLMGSGEPLDNYENTIRFLRMLSAENGIRISLRNVSVSTCGLVEQIDKLAKEDMHITLSVSLHAPTDAQRKEIMPIANRYSVQDTVEACRRYVQATGRRVSFEYALIDGVNTSLADADALADLVKGFQTHINLIPLNPVEERALRAPGQPGIDAFQRHLEQRGISVTRRREMGADISGACGQLRRRHLEDR